jgi:hypothetical protein
MTDHEPNPEGQQYEEKRPFQVEYRGVKASLAASESEKHPRTWREVGGRINAALMRVAVAPIEFLASLFESANSLLCGVSNLPSALAARVRGAHEGTDSNEGTKQASVESDLSARPRIESALDQLESKLTRIRERTHHAEIRDRSDGVTAVVVVRQDRPDEVGNIVQGSLAHGEVPAMSNDD